MSPKSLWKKIKKNVDICTYLNESTMGEVFLRQAFAKLLALLQITIAFSTAFQTMFYALLGGSMMYGSWIWVFIGTILSGKANFSYQERWNTTHKINWWIFGFGILSLSTSLICIQFTELAVDHQKKYSELLQLGEFYKYEYESLLAKQTSQQKLFEEEAYKNADNESLKTFLTKISETFSSKFGSETKSNKMSREREGDQQEGMMNKEAADEEIRRCFRKSQVLRQNKPSLKMKCNVLNRLQGNELEKNTERTNGISNGNMDRSCHHFANKMKYERIIKEWKQIIKPLKREIICSTVSLIVINLLLSAVTVILSMSHVKPKESVSTRGKKALTILKEHEGKGLIEVYKQLLNLIDSDPSSDETPSDFTDLSDSDEVEAIAKGEEKNDKWVKVYTKK